MPTTTKNLELFFQHAPAADLTALAAVVTTGIVDGVIIEVSAAGLFKFQLPAVATPDGRDIIAGHNGGVWIRQTLPALTTIADGRIAISNLQATQTPLPLTTNTTINGTGWNLNTAYTYENIAATIITLTISGGVTIRNPPVLNGSSTTIGFNPEDVFTITRYSDGTVLLT